MELMMDDAALYSGLMGAGSQALRMQRILWERHYAHLVRWLMRPLANQPGLSEADAEEVANQAFCKFFMAAGRFEGRCSVRSWLFEIAKNLRSDHSRKLGERMRREVEWDPQQDDAVAPVCALTEVVLDDCLSKGFTDFQAKYPQRMALIDWELHADPSEPPPDDYARRNSGAQRQYKSQCYQKLMALIGHCFE